MAVLFSLLAIIAVTWYEWELRPLQKYELAGIRLRLRDHSQRLVSPRVSSGIGRRISTASGVNWTRKKASSIDPEAPCQNGSIRLAESIAMSKQITFLLAAETSCDNTSYSATTAPFPAAVQQADSSPQPEAKTPPSSLPKKPVKADYLSRSVEAKSWE